MELLLREMDKIVRCTCNEICTKGQIYMNDGLYTSAKIAKMISTRRDINIDVKRQEKRRRLFLKENISAVI